MMWGYYDGWSWLWMAGMMVVFWGGIIAVAFFAVRAFAASKVNDQAMVDLRRRLAGGEISLDEYERTRKALEG